MGLFIIAGVGMKSGKTVNRATCFMFRFGFRFRYRFTFRFRGNNNVYSNSHLDLSSDSDSHLHLSSDSDSHLDLSSDSDLHSSPYSDSGSSSYSDSGSISDSDSHTNSGLDSDVNLLNIANNLKQCFEHRKQAYHENLLISDEKYAQELQLQEALTFSASQTNATSPSSQKSQKNASVHATSSYQNPLKSKRPTVKSKASELPESFCGICMDTKAPSEMFSNAKVCSHVYCSDCIRSHVSVKIKENIAKVKCPDPNCKGLIGPEICQSIVPKEVIERWEAALCESLILATHKFYCPFKDCSAMLVNDSGGAVTSSECPNCKRLFCAQCKVAWHSDLDCREFQSLKKNERNPEDIMLMKLAKKNKWKRCPSCKYYVEKDSGCNQMSCRCGRDFCYRCGKKDNGTHVCKSRD